MDDKDFYAECVKRVAAGPLKTKTDIQMVNIVLRNTPVEYSDMFNDKSVDELFGTKFDQNKETIWGATYKFIRDNQELYINPQYMNYSQVDKILNDLNLHNILRFEEFCDEDSKFLLNEAIYRGKFTAIVHFMEKGIMPSTDTAFFMDSLVNKSEDLTILKYLESKGVELSKIGSGRLIKSAALKNNHEALSYIMEKAPKNMQIVSQSIDAYIRQEYDVILSTKRREEKFSEITQKMTPILFSLLMNLSPAKMEMVKNNLKYDEMKEFLDKLYLPVSLENDLSNNDTQNKRMKI